ncbi:hypothetical protein BD410DRAFT_792047 [Rickenella mellea]|uniref:HIG1 domain-containing protein n=1 Tax=Rickenella mellea TaxID=50990 RepID=A0A4Y7PWK4_9AGAM|nr:hypothetical protein BD410DRAFT_792047 [Rickenella mellea]
MMAEQANVEAEETQKARAIQKLKENPGIPIGFVATCGALGMAFKRMQQRDSMGYQRWLRARVVAQGLTIVAIVWAGVKEWDKFSGKAPPPSRVNAAKEQRGFEERMREAEAAHRDRDHTGGFPIARPPSSEKNAAVETVPQRENGPKISGTSWLSWIGLSRK